MTLKVNKKEFSDWDDYYKDNEVERMPWYLKDLDHDIQNEIKSRNLTKGKFLDLGTGPGTQAIALAKLGFEVTGTDFSESAISKAKKLSNQVNFVADDVLNSKLANKEFDYIFDRGCFHIFDESQRKNYVAQMKRILQDDGILFLKCMSNEEKGLPDDEGPHLFSKQEILDTFSHDFDIQYVKPSVFHGTLEYPPKAWLVVMTKKS